MMRKMINNITRNRIQIILVMGLSTISLFLCLIALTNSLVFKAQIRDLEKMFQVELDKIGVIDFSFVSDEKRFGYDIDEIKNTIRHECGLTCGAFAEYYIRLDELWNNETYIECNRKEYSGTFLEENPDLSDVVLVDPEIMDIVDCGIEKEKLLPIRIANELYYPIYVGIDFKNIIKIDDILTNSTFDTKYIVKGYIEDADWFAYSDLFTFPVSSMKHKFIASFCKEEQTDSMTQMSTVSKIFVKMEKDREIFIDQIEKLALKRDIKMHISTIENKIQELQAENQEIIQMEYGFSMVVMICSMISVSSLFCAFILMQIKEYGIRLAFGETKGRLISFLVGRHLILIFIAMLFAILLTQKYLDMIVMGEFYQLFNKTLVTYAIPIMSFVSILYSLISLIPPMIMINRMELAQLVKEHI